MKPDPTLPIAKPSLVGLAADGRTFLKGVRCTACGAVAFPPQRHGCEHCGAMGLEDFGLEPAGTVVASSVVHIHAQPVPATPFTIAEVRLDGGPIVRARLAPVGGDPHGRRVHGMLRARESGSDALEFLFEVDAP
jgi:uncharacterized OB-fold protein